MILENLGEPVRNLVRDNIRFMAGERVVWGKSGYAVLKVVTDSVVGRVGGSIWWSRR